MLRLNDINKFVQKYVYDAITDYLPGKRTGVSCRNCDWVQSHRLTEDGPLKYRFSSDQGNDNVDFRF